MGKKEINRRSAIAGLGTLVGSVGSTGCADDNEASAPESYGVSQSALGTSVNAQPIKPLPDLPGVHAYAQKSVTAGSTVQFRISSASRYRLSIVRLGWYEDDYQRPDGTTSEWLIQSLPWRESAATQPIRPGSYIHVQNALQSSASFSQTSLEIWIRPWCNQFTDPSTNRWRGLITQYTYPSNCGFGLFLDDHNRVYAYFGNGGAFASQWLVGTSTALQWGAWNHVAVVFNAGSVSFFVNGVLLSSAAISRTTAVPGAAPLRIGAYGQDGLTDYILDADIAMPCIYSRALTAAEISTRANTKPATPPATTGLLGCWPLDEENGASVHDMSPEQRHGLIINRGTWMIGGPGYDASQVDPFAAYNPQTDATRGHALRLSADDLYDCGWTVTESVTLPFDLPPGVYAGRIEYPDESTHRYDVTFVVRRASGKPAAPILVLCNSNTWLAYNVAFPSDPNATEWGTGGAAASVPGAPAMSMYSDHLVTGVPTYQVGTNMPWSAFPYLRYGAPYSHLLRAERFLHNWLEQIGYDYDVVSDYDVHQSPALLLDYKVVIICGHSEYWSAPAYNGLKQFLDSGGRLFLASGNTMFWRVSYDPGGDVMECRKWPELVGGRPASKVGELYHSQDGARGGLMRQAGYPANQLVGLECIGYDSTAGSYTVRASDHPFFTTPEPSGLLNGTAIGVGAFHHEYDVRPMNIPGAPGPVAGSQPQLLADATITDGTGLRFDYQANEIAPNGLGSEIIDWARPTGGRVFAAGAIAVGSKLGGEPALGAIARNVLHQFGIAQRLEFLIVDASNHVRVRSWNGSAWEQTTSSWNDLGGLLDGPLQTVAWSPNNVSVMGRNSQGHLLYKYRAGANWAANWTDLGGQLQGRPAAVAYGRNRLSIFARDINGQIVAKWWDGTNWGPSLTDWSSLGGNLMSSDPAAIVFDGVKIGLAAIGADFVLYYRFWDGTTWNPWISMSGQYQFSPSFVRWGGNKLNLFAVNRVGGGLATRHFNGRTWDATTYQLGGSLISAPVVVSRRANEFSIFAVHSDGTIKVKWWDGSNWGPSASSWTSLGGSFTGSPTAVSWRGNHVSVMGMGPEGPSGKINYKWTDGVNWFPSLSTWTDIRGDVVGALGNPTSVAWIGA